MTTTFNVSTKFTANDQLSKTLNKINKDFDDLKKKAKQLHDLSILNNPNNILAAFGKQAKLSEYMKKQEEGLLRVKKSILTQDLKNLDAERNKSEELAKQNALLKQQHQLARKMMFQKVGAGVGAIRSGFNTIGAMGIGGLLGAKAIAGYGAYRGISSAHDTLRELNEIALTTDIGFAKALHLQMASTGLKIGNNELAEAFGTIKQSSGMLYEVTQKRARGEDVSSKEADLFKKLQEEGLSVPSLMKMNPQQYQSTIINKLAELYATDPKRAAAFANAMNMDEDMWANLLPYIKNHKKTEALANNLDRHFGGTLDKTLEGLYDTQTDLSLERQAPLMKLKIHYMQLETMLLEKLNPYVKQFDQYLDSIDWGKINREFSGWVDGVKNTIKDFTQGNGEILGLKKQDYIDIFTIIGKIGSVMGELFILAMKGIGVVKDALMALFQSYKTDVTNGEVNDNRQYTKKQAEENIKEIDKQIEDYKNLGAGHDDEIKKLEEKKKSYQSIIDKINEQTPIWYRLTNALKEFDAKLHNTVSGYGEGGSFNGNPVNVPIATQIDALRKAGFSEDKIQTMLAISQAESSGNKNAHNTNATTGDNSYGLWQINMLGDMGPKRRSALGITSNDQLYDPYVNARAAKMIYDQQGLQAWGAYTNGSYRKFLGNHNVSPTASSPKPSLTAPKGNNPQAQNGTISLMITAPDGYKVKAKNNTGNMFDLGRVARGVA